MTKMPDQSLFLNAGITELTFDEIEQVDGGIVHFAVAAVVVLGLLALGYCGEHNRDNQEKKNDG